MSYSLDYDDYEEQLSDEAMVEDNDEEEAEEQKEIEKQNSEIISHTDSQELYERALLKEAEGMTSQ